MSLGSDKTAAARTLRNEVSRLKLLLAVADDLDKLGEMESAEDELKARLAATQVELEAARVAVEEADKLAGLIAAAAKAEAAAIKDAATADKARIEEETASAVAKAKQESEAAIANSVKRKKALDAEIAGLNATRDRATAEADSALARLAEINADLDRVRRKVA